MIEICIIISVAYLAWSIFRPCPYSRMAKMYGDPDFMKEVRRRQVSINEVWIYNKYGAIIGTEITVDNPLEDQFDCCGNQSK